MIYRARIQASSAPPPKSRERERERERESVLKYVHQEGTAANPLEKVLN